ncbi:MAG: hypothetical protein NWT08_11960 [Akkermansiaceae bacterium]|jgi:flagellar basal body-associated protein FliL|nr:hypothetical protein [Akkermansiaceae bacterium]MDP4646340.1 hypothetical protein [Akkermansiaceae bacterium]MDP4720175.1 hypothetical protein [Akkermansiaceae bacterium]MDP4779943.1 hypothetical protein [Akkermansiaceae bacterium]MDP4847131.1 hypothetical protein [Akkermansiaceae bacterium]
MKSFLMLIIAFVVLIAVVGGSGVLFYLAKTSEIKRANQTSLLSSPVPQR